MSKFEPKITPRKPFMAVMESADEWCLRNVNENLRAFKAEFLRRHCSPDWASPHTILNAMLPDDPPKATGDDAADAARWRFFQQHATRFVCVEGMWSYHPPMPKWEVTYSDGSTVTNLHADYGSLATAIDSAMAREREASK